jgi:MFS family permease
MTTSGSAPVRNLWRNRDYMLYWWSRAGSMLGSQVSYIAVPLYAIATFHNATEASLVTVCSYGSGLLFALHAGVVGDRKNRNLVMVAADLGRALAMGMLAWQAAGASPSLLLTCAIALGVGALNVTFDSAAAAALPELVGKDLVARAMARNQSRDFTLALVGPMLGTVLFGVSPAWAFAFDLGTYVLSAVLLSLISTPLTPSPDTQPTTTSSIVSIRSGIACVLNDRPLRQTTLYLGVLNFVLTASVFAVVAHFQTVGQTSSAGIVLAAQSIGGLAGSLAASRLCVRFSPTMLLHLHGGIWFVGLMVIAMFPTTAVTATMLALVWLVAPAVRVAFGSHLVAVVPVQMRARVNSATALSGSALGPLGPLVAGLLFAVTGFGQVITALALVALAAATGLITLPDRINSLGWRHTRDKG